MARWQRSGRAADGGGMMSIYGAQTLNAPRFDDAARDYDALLVLSFGGPEGHDDVMPFLLNVTRAGASRRSGWRRSPSTTTTSAASARSTTRTRR